MPDFLIDYSQIQLQENIPLSSEELNQKEKQQKLVDKTIPIVVGGATLFTMILIAWFIKDSFAHFQYYDYLLFAGAALALFVFCYTIARLVILYGKKNWRKDKIHGKNKLASVIIDRDKTEYGHYLTFAGKKEDEKIRIKVSPEDYSMYNAGAKVIVTYLKFSNEVLELTTG